MVDSIVSTSNWSHNCGMHVIADYMVEKIKQDNPQDVFNGTAYDELLESFKKIYKQEDLTWETIQTAVLKASRIDSQIIWGYALRMMMPAVVESNEEYKIDLYNSFLAAMNLYKEWSFEELQKTYPIIFFTNQNYFKAEALNPEINSEKYLNYWNEKGFKDYCSALIHIIEENESFLWLSKEELSIFCQYFNFEFDFEDQLDAAADLDPQKLYFSNSTQTHWERKIASSHLDPVPAVPQTNSEFYEQFLTKGVSNFLSESNVLGEIFFSDLYSDPKLGLDLYKNIQDDCLRKNLINKDSRTLIDNILKNKDHIKPLSDLLEFGIVYFDYKVLNDWLKRIETSNLYPYFFPKILVGAVKYQKQEIFNQLLIDFPKVYTSSACMPALILAAQQDNHEIAHQLLSRSDFDTKGLVSKAMSYIQPAFSHILNQFDENNIPALYYAVKNINIPLAKTLLEKGACATYEVNRRVAFEWALDTKNFEMITLLIETVPNAQLLTLYNKEGNNCFHLCFENKELGNYLDKFIDVYLKDHHNTINEVLYSVNSAGQNILHLSASMGYLEGIEYCLEHQMSLFSQDSQGNTALHFAAAYGQLESAKFLVRAIQKLNDQTYLNYNKFDLNEKNNHKRSPLHLAHDNKHIQMAQYLKTTGCIDWVHDAYTELYLVCQLEKPDFDAFCLKNKDKLNTQGSDDFSLLHYICFLNETKQHTRTIIKKLIEQGAKHGAVSYQRASPLHLAALRNNVQAIEELLLQGAFINAIDSQGRTACHYAVESDAKEAFILLKDKGANLELAAFPSAIDEEPLTAAYVAEQINGNIAAYLKPLQAQNLPDKPQVKFHSFEHKGAYWVESKLGMEHHYVSNLCSELHNLEGSSTYQFLSMFKVGLCVAGASMIGPSAGAIEAFKQSILYLSPTLKQQAGQFYYNIKPAIHNYNFSYASRGLDITATGVSLAYHGLCKAMNYTDLANNFGRRIIGGAAGIGGLKIAQGLGAEREAQAATLFLAREFGYACVDAYHASSPERKAHQAFMQNHINPTLNQAYEVWSSILSKDQAERFIQTAQFAVEFKASIYQTVGESERAGLDLIEGYTGLQTHFSNFLDFALNNRFSQCVLAPPQMLRLEVELKLNALSEQTNSVLRNIEEFIHTHLVPESEYQSLMLHYAHIQKGLLIQNLKQQAEAQLKIAIELDNQQDITYYEEKIKAYEQDILASEKSAKEHYEQTAKGKIANQYKNIQEKGFNTWSESQDLERLNDLNPEIFIDMAYADLGDDISADELREYIVTMINAQNLPITQEGLEDFKLNIDPKKLHNTDFKANLKSTLSAFWQTQKEKHLPLTISSIAKKLQETQHELEEVSKNFAEYASPEELRILELNKSIEVKNYKYEIYSSHKKLHIQSTALRNAKYVKYIKAFLNNEAAEQDVTLCQAKLEHVEFENNQEINRIKFFSEKQQQILNDNTLDIDALVSELIQSYGTEKIGRNERRDGADLMLLKLVATGFITVRAADSQYKHPFYEAWKSDKDNLEASLRKVLENAWNEVSEKGMQPIIESEKRIYEIHQEIVVVKKELQTKIDTKNNAEIMLIETKEATLSKLTMNEQYDFKNFTNHFKETMLKLTQYNQSQLDQQLTGQKYQKILQEKAEIDTEIKNKTDLIDSLTNFDMTTNEIDALISEAKKATNDRGKIGPYIIKRIKNKLIFVDEDLSNQLTNKIKYNGGVSNSHDDFYDRIKVQLAYIKTKYIPKTIPQIKGSVDLLKEYAANLDKNLEILKFESQLANDKASASKKQYVEQLSSDEKLAFHENEKKSVTPVVMPPQNKVESEVYDWRYPSYIIYPVIYEGLSKYTDETKLAGFYADKIMSFRAQLYPEITDKETLKKQREFFFNEIKTYELKRLHDKPDRVIGRLYKFFVAKINNTPKERHKSKTKRRFCSATNEIVSGVAGGYRPFKSYIGGEDNRGQVGLQANYRTDGIIGLNIQSNHVPVFKLYQSELPARKIDEPAQPKIFEKNFNHTPVNEANIEKSVTATLPQPSEIATLPHIPSLANSVFQGGVFEKKSPNFPGPLRPEHLPEEIKTPTQTFVPFGYQHTKQPAIPLRSIEEQSIPRVPTTMPSIENQSKSLPQPKQANPKPAESKSVKSSAAPVNPALPKKAQPASKPAVIPLEAKQPAPVIFSSAKKSSDGFLKMFYRSYKGENSPEISAWKRSYSERFPAWQEFTEAMGKTVIPVTQLSGLFIEAAGESVFELIETGKIITVFAAQEAGRSLRGDDLKTVKALGILKLFVQEDFARAQLNEKTQTAKMALALVDNFSALSKEERFKSFSKIYISSKAALAAANQVTRLGLHAAESVPKLPAVFPNIGVPVSNIPARIGNFSEKVFNSSEKIVSQVQPEVLVFSTIAKKGGQGVTYGSKHNAANVNAQMAMNQKMRALQKAQNEAVRFDQLSDGRIRYYSKEIPSRGQGPTRGASNVTEYNPQTGQVRGWYECYNHAGKVNRIHPKMIDGQTITAQHYPPTQKDLSGFIKNK